MSIRHGPCQPAWFFRSSVQEPQDRFSLLRYTSLARAADPISNAPSKAAYAKASLQFPQFKLLRIQPQPHGERRNPPPYCLAGASGGCGRGVGAPLSWQSRPARWLRAAPSSQRVPRRLFVASYKDVAGQKITTLARGDNVLRALAILSSRLGRCPRGNSLSFHRESATIPNFRRNAAARPNLKAPSNRNRKAIARGAAET